MINFRKYLVISVELRRREMSLMLLVYEYLAILCRSQNMCWFSEPTVVL